MGGRRFARGQTASLTVAAACLAAGAAGCDGAPARASKADPVPHAEVRVVPRTPYLSLHSCEEQCHAEREASPEPRKLVELHTDRVIDHGRTGNQWCTDCHYAEDYDLLRLDDGTEISFDEAYRLCGQCHAPKLRDWELGIHGVETGSWKEGARRRSCPVCHDPHDPTRPDFVSLPPPAPPREPWPRGHLSAAAQRADGRGADHGHP